MLDVLKFIFSDFWIWCGSVILLCVVGNTCIGVANAILRRKSQS